MRKPKDITGYIQFGILTNKEIYNISDYMLNKNIEKGLALARLKTFAEATKHLPNEKKDNGTKIQTPYNAYMEYRSGHITLKELEDRIKLWKEASDANTLGNYGYAKGD